MIGGTRSEGMKIARGVLVAGVLLAVVQPAVAAERNTSPPTRESVPCPAWGPGFVRAPGSSTCIRVRGRVTAEYGRARTINREDIAGYGASGRVEMDARSQTEYGPLRTVVRVKGERASGGH